MPRFSVALLPVLLAVPQPAPAQSELAQSELAQSELAQSGEGVAQPDAAATVPETVPVTVEAYYRIRWGHFEEFMELFQRNHLPILEEAERRGLIGSITMDVPFTHMTGEARWDLRVRITYRDASASMMTDPAWGPIFDETTARIAPDAERFAAEERRRFEIVDEHWDVVLYPEI